MRLGFFWSFILGESLWIYIIHNLNAKANGRSRILLSPKSNSDKALCNIGSVPGYSPLFDLRSQWATACQLLAHYNTLQSNKFWISLSLPAEQTVRTQKTIDSFADIILPAMFAVTCGSCGFCGSWRCHVLLRKPDSDSRKLVAHRGQVDQVHVKPPGNGGVSNRFLRCFLSWWISRSRRGVSSRNAIGFCFWVNVWHVRNRKANLKMDTVDPGRLIYRFTYETRIS